MGVRSDYLHGHKTTRGKVNYSYENLVKYGCVLASKMRPYDTQILKHSHTLGKALVGVVWVRLWVVL